MYRSWREMLSASLEICPVQYPGRGKRFSEPLICNLVEMANEAADGLRPLANEPFVLFGYSMGALIAFEIARRFEKEGMASLKMLLVAGARAPHLRESDKRTYDLPDAEFRAELRRINGTPARILNDAEVMELLMPVIRADFQAVQTYQFKPGPPLRCPIVAFGGRNDNDVSEADLDGWGEHTVSTFSRTLIDGTHFFVNESSPQLIDRITCALKILFTA